MNQPKMFIVERHIRHKAKAEAKAKEGKRYKA